MKTRSHKDTVAKAISEKLKTHTPAPWTFQAWNERYPNEQLAENYYFINAGETGAKGFRLAGYLSLPDVSLITAAPKLLEALQAIYARLQGEYDHPALVKYGLLLTDSDEDILNIAGAAIEEAEG